MEKLGTNYGGWYIRNNLKFDENNNMKKYIVVERNRKFDSFDLINEDKHDLFELVNIMKNPPQPEVSTSEEEQQDE